MPAIDHVHTYVRLKSRKDHYKCNDPYCTHIAHKELIEGKANKCPFCQTEFVLSKDDLRRAKPRCINCSDTAKARAHKKAKDVVVTAFDHLAEDTKRKIELGQLAPIHAHINK